VASRVGSGSDNSGSPTPSDCNVDFEKFDNVMDISDYNPIAKTNKVLLITTNNGNGVEITREDDQ
jgi:hypothetical protein